MSRDGSIDLDFADGTYHFRLAWGELRKLQEACDTGPYVVLDRLISGRWRVDDISETVRLGLIGGGIAPVDALKLVREYVQDRPPLENLVLAQRVLGAAVVGTAEEEVGKKSEAASQDGSGSPTSPTESSDLPPRDVDGMSVWQYMAVFDAWAEANDPDGDKRLSDGEKDDLWQWLQGKAE